MEAPWALTRPLITILTRLLSPQIKYLPPLLHQTHHSSSSSISMLAIRRSMFWKKPSYEHKRKWQSLRCCRNLVVKVVPDNYKWCYEPFLVHLRGIQCDLKHRIQSKDQCLEKCRLTSTRGKVNMISAQWLSLIGCYRDISPCHALAVITANIIIIIVIAITIIGTILISRRYWGKDVVGQPSRATER